MWCDASSRSTIAVNRSSEVSSWAMLAVGRCSSRGNDEVYVSTKQLQCWSSVLRRVWKCIIMVAKVIELFDTSNVVPWKNDGSYPHPAPLIDFRQ